MEESSALNTIIGLLCWAGLCIIPLGAIAGGVVFFRKRKQKAESRDSVGAAAVPASSGVGGSTPSAFVDSAVSSDTAAPASVDTAVSEGQAPAADPFVPPVSSGAAAAAVTPTGPANGSEYTPSEIVWLRGEAFSDPAGVLNSVKVLYNDTKVKGPDLAVSALQAAVLALVKAGDAQLQPGKRKGLLRESDTLFLVPTGRDEASGRDDASGRGSNWPAGSYEAELLRTARAASDPKNNNIPVLVFHVMQDEHNIPWMQVFEPLKIGLAQRGVLEASKGALGLSIKFALPPASAERVAKVDVEPVRQTLRQFAEAQPALAELLKKEIKEGISRRQESSD